MRLRFRVRGLMWRVLISAVLFAGYRKVQQGQQRAWITSFVPLIMGFKSISTQAISR